MGKYTRVFAHALVYVFVRAHMEKWEKFELVHGDETLLAILKWWSSMFGIQEGTWQSQNVDFFVHLGWGGGRDNKPM